MTKKNDDDQGARVEPSEVAQEPQDLPRSPQPDRSQHTPGPWRFEIRTEYPNGHVNGIWGPRDEEIVVTDSGYYPPTIADARLIAAAPELLEACRRLLKFNEELCTDVNVSTHYPSADFARAAIAKAGG